MREALVILCALFAAACAPEVGACDTLAAREIVYDDSGQPAYAGQALMVRSCGSGAFCHSPEAIGDARRGVPSGLDYDLRLAGDDTESTRRLRTQLALVASDRDAIWEQVAFGRMPIGGDDGEAILSAAPHYHYVDNLTGARAPVPELSDEEGLEILRNWLACRAPVVERTAERPSGEEPIGAIVAMRDVRVLEPEWPDIFEHLIEPRCATSPCHGISSAGGLDLRDETDGLAALESQASSDEGDCGGRMLIAPGDPDHSFFVRKLEGHILGDSLCGDPMPVGGAPVNAESLAAIRQWIAAGAAAE